MTKYAELTTHNLEVAIEWVDFYTERARWAGFSTVASRGRKALRDLRAEHASR